MDNVALIFINLIVLAVFGAIFFARGEVEKDLIHRQRIATDVVGGKVEKLIDKIREQDKAIGEMRSQIEGFDKRITSLASTFAKAKEEKAKDYVDPLSNFVNSGQESEQ